MCKSPRKATVLKLALPPLQYLISSLSPSPYPVPFPRRACFRRKAREQEVVLLQTGGLRSLGRQCAVAYSHVRSRSDIDPRTPLWDLRTRGVAPGELPRSYLGPFQQGLTGPMAVVWKAIERWVGENLDLNDVSRFAPHTCGSDVATTTAFSRVALLLVHPQVYWTHRCGRWAPNVTDCLFPPFALRIRGAGWCRRRAGCPACHRCRREDLSDC